MTWEVRDLRADTNTETEEAEENTKIDMYWVSQSIIDIERQKSKPIEVCVQRNFTYDRY